jgi:hypothetical protein
MGFGFMTHVAGQTVQGVFKQYPTPTTQQQATRNQQKITNYKSSVTSNIPITNHQSLITNH